jgi:hypothetical protein
MTKTRKLKKLRTCGGANANAVENDYQKDLHVLNDIKRNIEEVNQFAIEVDEILKKFGMVTISSSIHNQERNKTQPIPYLKYKTGNYVLKKHLHTNELLQDLQKEFKQINELLAEVKQVISDVELLVKNYDSDSENFTNIKNYEARKNRATEIHARIITLKLERARLIDDNAMKHLRQILQNLQDSNVTTKMSDLHSNFGSLNLNDKGPSKKPYQEKLIKNINTEKKEMSKNIEKLIDKISKSKGIHLKPTKNIFEDPAEYKPLYFPHTLSRGTIKRAQNYTEKQHTERQKKYSMLRESIPANHPSNVPANSKSIHANANSNRPAKIRKTGKNSIPLS